MSAISRRKIIRGDLAKWDGRNATVSSPDASGGTITGIPIGNEVDILSVYSSDNSRTDGTINAAINRLGSTACTIVFAPGTWTIDANVTIPSNIVAHIPAGVIFDVASGKTLTFNGPIMVEYAAQWYSGSGTVTWAGSLLGTPATAAEIAAGVTPSNYGYDPLDIRRYGAVVGTDAITAFNAAVAVAAAQGGGDIYVPAGTWTIGSTVTVAGTRVSIVGEGANVSILKFDPASADVLLHFTNGASSIVQCHVRGLGFYSTNSVTKTAIQMDDARACVIEEIGISSGNWAGSGSIFLHFKGRDTCTVRKISVYCARPILLSQCTNHASLDTDHFHFEDMEVGSTETTGKVIEAEDGVVLSNVTFDGYQAWVLGKYGFYWNDTTSPIDSSCITFSGIRTEQASDSSGYSFYLASTANDMKGLRFENCYLDLDKNGIYLRKPETVSMDDCFLGGTTGRTNLDITFQSNTNLQLQNTFVNTGSTVTLTNAVACVESPWASSNRACASTGFWRYDEAALVSRKSRREDGVLSFKWKGTMTDVSQINLPVLSSGGADVAHIRIAAGHATGPILEGGQALWRPGTVTLVGVSSNVVTSSTGGKLAIIDNTNALSIVNRLGQTVDVVLDVVWSD